MNISKLTAILIGISLNGLSALATEHHPTAGNNPYIFSLQEAINSKSHLRFNTINPFKAFSINENKLTPGESENSLQIAVDNSSSAIIFPFSEVLSPYKIQLKWHLEDIERKIEKESKEFEKTRAGDDFYLRIGLILSGKAQEQSFLEKQFHWRSDLQEFFPESTRNKISGKVLMFVDKAENDEGLSWPSPYEAENVMMVSIKPAKVSSDNWREIEIDLFKYIEQLEYLCAEEEHCGVVGLWLMPDGDSTDAKFKIEVRELRILL